MTLATQRPNTFSHRHPSRVGPLHPLALALALAFSCPFPALFLPCPALPCPALPCACVLDRGSSHLAFSRTQFASWHFSCPMSALAIAFLK
ncbi:hypothetical protein IWZ03DRAFT_171464 [Phyllosticta citriasiana]|uniref:Secreted protein n=1 Tax=Phyllosticta citriasiana TaxID=595635 RepID=A0ABR1KLP5_9PEZI